MLNINHTICPECSIGCGLNVISKDGIIVGINPFKNHEINEGKNCKNCTQYIDKVSNKKIKNFNYGEAVSTVKEKIARTNNDKITILTSGNTDNNDLDNLIKFADINGYELISYEHEFTKINPELIVTYDEIEQADQIIVIGDIFRKNSLIARRIIHAQQNGAKTINIHTKSNLTGFNSDEFIQIDSCEQLNQIINSLYITNNTILIINEISSKKYYENLIKLVEEKNIKILPLLKHPNSYSILEKIKSLSKKELINKLEDSELLFLVNENPLEYLGGDVLNNKKVVSFTQNCANIGLTIPLKLWCQKDTSFTNSAGITQEYSDAIQDEQNSLKTLSEVLELL